MPPILENVATAAMTVLSLALALIAGRAWWHTRSRKVLLLTAGFFLFFAKGVVLSIGLFTTAAWEDQYLLPSLVLDLCALSLFYASVLKRSGT